jgi:hypothetical protein
VLTVEQSVGGSGCQYPKGYVEPVPELYRALGRAAKLMSTAYGVSSKEHFPFLMQTDDANDGSGRYLFNHWQYVTGMLAEMAEKELAGAPMSKKELEFLSRTVDMHRDKYTGERNYDGWYPELHREGRWRVGESKPVVADVHTDADRGQVLQTAVGHPGLMIIAVDSGEDLSLFGGPVYNYYSFKSSASNRMTDRRWQRLLEKNRAPGKPAFTRGYWAAAHETKWSPDMGDTATDTDLSNDVDPWK